MTVHQRFGALAAVLLTALVLLFVHIQGRSTAEGGAKWPLVANLFGNEAPFPSGPVTILVPAAPGGGWDQLARVAQRVLQDEQVIEVPIVVENRAGGGGSIGLTELITQNRGNPHIMMIGGKTMVSSILMQGRSFNANRATPLATLATEYSVIAVPESSPFETLEDLLNAFRENPSGIVWGGGAAGGSDHLIIGAITKTLGIDPSQLNFVAYSGGGQTGVALLSHQVDAAVGGPEWRDLASTGHLRILGVSAPARLTGIDAPTLREAGLDVVMDNWRFIFAAPGISPREEAILSAAVKRMRETPLWREMLERQGLYELDLTGSEMEDFLTRETTSIAALLKDLEVGAARLPYAVAGPYVILGGLLVFVFCTGTVLVIGSLRRRLANGAAHSFHTLVAPQEGVLAFAKAAGIILAYILVLPAAGFLLATPVCFFLLAHLIGSVRLLPAAIISIAFTASTYFIFEKVLAISTP